MMIRWHITVKEPPDVNHPYERRFAFDTAQEALHCYVEAMRAGFEVRVNQVRKGSDSGVRQEKVQLDS